MLLKPMNFPSVALVMVLLALFISGFKLPLLADEPDPTFETGKITDMQLSPDGSLVALSGSSGVWIYEVDQLDKLYSFLAHPTRVESIAFTPDSSQIVSGSLDGVLRIWDIQSQEIVMSRQEHNDWVLSIDVSKDGSRLVSSGLDGRVVIWNRSSGKSSWSSEELYNDDKHIESVQFDANSKYLILTLLDAFAIKNDQGNLEFSRRGAPEIQVWDIETRSLISKARVDVRRIHTVGVHPDGHHIAAVTGNNAFSLIELQTLQLKKSFPLATNGSQASLEPISWPIPDQVLFSPDGSKLLINLKHNGIVVWNVHNEELLGGSLGADKAIFTPDGQFLLLAGFNTFGIWEVDSSNFVTLYVHDNSTVSHSRESDCVDMINGSVGMNSGLVDHNGVVLSVDELSGADVSGSSFIGGNLHGVNLSNTKLQYTDLRCVDLSEANLRGADLTGSNLMYADLRGAQLAEATLNHTNLACARLSGTSLSGANLRHADFTDATTQYVNFVSIGLVGCFDLRNIIFDVMNLDFVDLSNADLSNVNLQNKSISFGSFDGAILKGTNLSNSQLRSSFFRNANLSDANLASALLQGADMSNANLRNSVLTGANLTGVNLSGADLSGALLSNTILPDGTIFKSTTNLSIFTKPRSQ